MKQILDSRVLAKQLAAPPRGECPFVLAIGSGASASSGISTCADITLDWKRKVFRPTQADAPETEIAFDEWISGGFDEWRKAKGSPASRHLSDYEFLFTYLFPTSQERQLFLERLVEDATPSEGYAHLAGIIADRRINRIVTPNYDDLLADSLFKIYNVKPIVYGVDSSIRAARLASKRPKIVKLHGDFLFDFIGQLGEQWTTTRLDHNTEDKLIEVCKGHGMVVAGYSGRDESIMAPIRDMLRKDDYLNGGLHWCLHDSDHPIPEPVRHLATNYPNRVNFYSIPSFDAFMKEVFDECGCQFPADYARAKTTERSGIFISYRREDTSDATGRLYDRLASHFGEDVVVIDIDAIPFGTDFAAFITEHVRSSKAVLAIIGDQWVTCSDPRNGTRRIDDPNDWVRVEIRTALENSVPVIPVLSGRAAMPPVDELPHDIQALSSQNAAQARAGRDYNQQVQRLIKTLEEIGVPPHSSPNSN